MICWVCDNDISGQCKLELQCGHSIHTECMFRSVYYEGGFQELFGRSEFAHCGRCYMGVFQPRVETSADAEVEFIQDRRSIIDISILQNKDFLQELKTVKKIHREYVKEHKIMRKENVRLCNEIKKETEFMREDIRQKIQKKTAEYRSFISKTSMRKKYNALKKIWTLFHRKWNITSSSLFNEGLITHQCVLDLYLRNIAKAHIIYRNKIKKILYDILK